MNPISKIILIFASITFLIIGVIPSLVSGNLEWFSRAGSALTAIGLLVTYLDFSGFIENNVADISARIDRILASRGAAGIPKKTIDEQKHTIFSDLKSSLKLTEFLTIFLGTIIWGYGDLLQF